MIALTDGFDKAEFEKLLKIKSCGKRLIIGIDGKCAAGKTTLAGKLLSTYGYAVFHADDFFLRPEQRSKERLDSAGGNFDRERFEQEVLIPLSGNDSVIRYRKFSCKEMRLLPETAASVGNTVIIEGSYCLHPELQKYYDVKIFCDVDSDEQAKRIYKRNPDNAEMFFAKWIPLENKYFDTFDIKNCCDIILKG